MATLRGTTRTGREAEQIKEEQKKYIHFLFGWESESEYVIFEGEQHIQGRGTSSLFLKNLMPVGSWENEHLSAQDKWAKSD